MNLYKVTTPTNSACVFATDVQAAIDCFIDALLEEAINICESDINCIEQIASEEQSRLFKSDFPNHLVISFNGVEQWLKRNGFKITPEIK